MVVVDLPLGSGLVTRCPTQEREASMDSGLLWCDSSNKRSTKVKILEAAEAYHEKFKQRPNLCVTRHEPEISEIKITSLTSSPVKIKIKHDKSIPPHHFWIGREKKKGAKREGQTYKSEQVVVIFWQQAIEQAAFAKKS